ncbi:MAG TPA: nuclear transport factor 2 family protein [Verrucomicrobiales bacterium]|nr:nuclear transport factor 2 family protein [Verrucomicrobiales bacterium]
MKGGFGIGMRWGLGLCWLAFPAFALGQEDDAREADHAALRELRERFGEALNGRDFAALEPLLAESFTFVAVDNRKFTGVEELKSYWESLFTGKNAVLASITVAPEADEETFFFGPGYGMAQGSSRDVYDFNVLGRREMPSRWTAVVHEEAGQWKVSHVHMSANVLDNPVVSAVRKASSAKAGMALLVGLTAGGVLGWSMGRSRRKAVSPGNE